MEKNTSIIKTTKIPRKIKAGFVISLCVAGAATFFGCPSNNSPTAPTTYQLTVSAGAGGTISAPASSPLAVNKGASTTITAVPSSGFAFSKWTVVSGTATISDSVLATTTVALSTGNASIRANFAATTPTYQLTVLAGTGGSIDAPSPATVTVMAGASTVITAHANSGYMFAKWVIPGDSLSVAYLNSPSTTIQLFNANDTVRAEFISIAGALNPVDNSAFEKEQGVSFSYYKGTWTTLPDFSTLTPDSTGPCDTIDVAAIAHQANNFGVVFSGYFNPPAPGNYTFYLKSSDGSELLINDSLILKNDGIHATALEESTTIALSAGAYLIEVRYFDASSAPSLNVSYACTDVGLTKGTITIDALTRPSLAPTPKITVTKPAGGETYHIGDTIHVQWIYKHPRGQVFVSLSTDNGISWNLMSTLAFPGDVTTFDYPIPLDATVTSTAIVQVREYPPYDIVSNSKAFSIVQ